MILDKKQVLIQDQQFYVKFFDQKNGLNQFVFITRIEIIRSTESTKKSSMVKLGFKTFVPGPLPEVWAFFSQFQNFPKWDPNTLKVIPKTKEVNKVGAQYLATSLWKGDHSQLEYKIIEYVQHKKIVIVGKNTLTKTIDQIKFQPTPQGTHVDYSADISLRHVFQVFTPLIVEDLHKLAEQAQKGFIRKSKQMWG